MALVDIDATKSAMLGKARARTVIALAALGAFGPLAATSSAALIDEWPLNGSLNATTGTANLASYASGTASYSSSVSTTLRNEGYTASAGVTVSAGGNSNGTNTTPPVNALQAATSLSFSNSASYSMSIWFNITNPYTSDYMELMEIGEYNSAASGDVSIRLNGGQLQIDDNSNGAENTYGASVSGLPAAGSWVNVVASINHTSAALYVDGTTFATTSSYTEYSITNGPVTLGFRYAGTWQGNDFSGLLSDAQIYNTALTQQDAMNIYNTGVPEPASIGFLALSAVGLLKRKRRQSSESPSLAP